MSEELYNSNDYCKLAEELEELKKENAELARDKDHLMNLFMESSEYVYSVVSNMKINDLRQKCKRLEADYEISNRELLVKQVEITALRAEIERLQAERRWIPVSEKLPEVGETVLIAYNISRKTYIVRARMNKEGEFRFTKNTKPVTHWMPLPESPTTITKPDEYKRFKNEEDAW